MHERILRLNIAGSPVDWLNWEEAVTLQARGMVAWTLGSPCMIVRGGRSRLTGEQSQANAPIRSWLAKAESMILQGEPRISPIPLYFVVTSTCVCTAAKATESETLQGIMWYQSRGG